MKILMTGMTSRGIGSLKLRHDYVSLSDILGRACMELGHQVDVGRVLPGEDLDEYDAALVLVYWVSSLSAHYVHETSLALAQLGSRAAVYVDDWRAQTLGDDYALHVEKPVGWERHRGRFRKGLWDQLTEDQVDLGRDTILSMVRPDCPFRMLVPLHGWGDLDSWAAVSGRPVTARMTAIDPTPLVPLPDIRRVADRDREQRWVLATIQEHDRWLERQGLSWPVLKLGGAKKLGGGVNPGREAMGRVVPEAQVVQAYADSWGVLVPPYASSGSGWWRPRYTFAAHARAVVSAPWEDALRLGEGYRLAADAAALERAVPRGGVLPSGGALLSQTGRPGSGLRALAEQQAAEQGQGSWTRDRLMAVLQEVLEERASGRGRMV